MNTKSVCKELNISPKSLRIYEQYGIIVPERKSNNYRDYTQNDIQKLRQLLLLKDMGIPLKDIKKLLEKEFDDNKIIRGLDLQLKAVENRITELENIRDTLIESINDSFSNSSDGNNIYFDKISKCLNENKENRKNWVDKWNFDSWAKSYDVSVQNSSGDPLKLFESYNDILKAVAQRIIGNNCIKVLDIGCGTCNLYGELKENNIVYTGIDQSIEMLMQAKRKYPDVKLRMGNFLDKPFIENEFDAVVSTYAFHHLNSMEKENSIKFMLNYLNPEGRIIIADLMFLNETERQKQKEYYISIGREDLWEVIEDEYYTDIEKIKSYIDLQGYKVNYKHIANFTWLLEIEK